MLRDYKEKETRKEMIDKRLVSSGWKILREGKTIPKDGTFAVKVIFDEQSNIDLQLSQLPKAVLSKVFNGRLAI